MAAQKTEKKTKERSPYLQLLDILRANAKRAQFIGRAYKSPLSTSEAFILVELDIDPEVTATELGTMLNLEKSSISRMLKKLEEEGYLFSLQSTVDKRRKRLALTEKGREFLTLHDEFNNKQIAEHLSRVSMNEVSELQRYFKSFADGGNALPIKLRPGENPLLIEMRRLTRVHGVLGGDIYGSGFSMLEFQTLAEIYYSKDDVFAVDLSKSFSVPPNTLSQLISRFSKKGLITQGAGDGDRRYRPLQLTKKGIAELRGIEGLAEEIFEDSLKKLKGKEIEDFLSLFRKYLGLQLTEGERGAVLAPAQSVRRVSGDKERSDARAFLILNLVRTNRYLDAPELLVGEDSFIYQLLYGDSIVGVAEFRKGEGKSTVNLHNYIVAVELEDSEQYLKFLLKASELVLQEEKFRTVQVHVDSIHPQWQEELAGRIGLSQNPSSYLFGLDKVST